MSGIQKGLQNIWMQQLLLEGVQTQKQTSTKRDSEKGIEQSMRHARAVMRPETLIKEFNMKFNMVRLKVFNFHSVIIAKLRTESSKKGNV